MPASVRASTRQPFRSRQPETSPVAQFGPFRLDTANAQLLRDGEAVPLKTFDVLRVLVSRAGQLVEKDALMREVWPDTFVEEANVSRHVWALRKALGTSGSDERYIETVPRRGYRRGRTLMAQPFDVDAGRLSADAAVVVDVS
jgi:DNA-binding winged helix-turn-helix (wHTH) protein